MNYKINYLSHHGILGQKWGQRNGPPYPLGAGDHSAREKKAGWKKSLKSGSSKDSKIRFKDNQKKWIKRGAIIAASGLAIAGGIYLAKSGKATELIGIGKNAFNGYGRTSAISPKRVGLKPSKIDGQLVKRINAKNLGTRGGSINCTHCSIAYSLNSLFNKPCNAKGFSGVDEISGMVSDGRDINIVKSILSNTKEFKGDWSDIPNGTSGILGVENTRRGFKHALNYEKTKDGILTIVDTQNGTIHPLSAVQNKWKPIIGFDLSNSTIKDGIDDILKNIIE